MSMKNSSDTIGNRTGDLPFPQISEKNPNIKFNKDSSNGSRVVTFEPTDRQTDRHDEDFRYFATAPKI
jgi:hypothetical protein